MKLAPLAIGIVLLATSLRARAESPAHFGVDLEWRAGPGCPNREQVLSEVARSFHSANASNQKVSARATVEPADRGSWQVTLVFESGEASRSRSFEAESCEAAADAVAFILAAAVNPDVAAAPPVPAPAPSLLPAPPPASPPATAPAAATSSERASASPSATSLHLTVSPSFVLDTGSLPNAAPGAELAVGLQAGRFRFEVAGAGWASQSATASTSGGGAGLHLYAGDARVGFTWRVGPIAVVPMLCAGLEVLGASGFGGTTSNFNPTGIFAALGGGGLLAWKVAEHLALRFGVEAEVPLFRPTFVVLEPPPATASVVNEPRVALGRASAGVELDF